MIKFFRNIRKQLLDEGKTGKYFKYAIGEIVLVVIGILIALQINNWNEHRKTNQALKIALSNIINDLQSDHKKLKEENKTVSFRFHSMQYLLKTSGNTIYDADADESVIPSFRKDNETWDKNIPTDYDKEFIQLAFLWSHRTANIRSNKSTLEELKSTGMYSYISRDLKLDLSNYYNKWDNYFKDIVNKLAEDWQESLGEDGFLNSDTYQLDDPLSLIKDNPKRVNLLKRMIRETGWRLVGLKDMGDISMDLITSIEQEINSL